MLHTRIEQMDTDFLKILLTAIISIISVPDNYRDSVPLKKTCLPLGMVKIYAPSNTDEQSACRTNSLYTICSFDCISAFTIVKLKKPYAAFLITMGITGRNKELFTQYINQLQITRHK